MKDKTQVLNDVEAFVTAMRTTHIARDEAKANIRTILNETGISQRELAKHLGVSQKAISKWVRGICKPKALTANWLEELVRRLKTESLN